jgi:hypothetical protein
LWEQVAAQGQTVLVARGGSGSAGCDDANDQWTTSYGLAVNGLASTSWNVAVGGTDFYYSNYASGSLSNLPGRSYQVWAQYSGDGSYEGSYSDLQTVTIAPANGSLTLGGFSVGSISGYLNPADACLAVSFPDEGLFIGTLGGSFGPYPNGYSFDANEPVAAAAVANGGFTNLVDGFLLPQGYGTGTVTFSLDGKPFNTSSLNAASCAAWVAPAVLGAGNHSISATYSGDASYGSATATPFAFSVAQARTSLSVSSGGNCAKPAGSPVVCAVSAGYNLTVMA